MKNILLKKLAENFEITKETASSSEEKVIQAYLDTVKNFETKHLVSRNYIDKKEKNDFAAKLRELNVESVVIANSQSLMNGVVHQLVNVGYRIVGSTVVNKKDYSSIVSGVWLELKEQIDFKSEKE